MKKALDLFISVKTTIILLFLFATVSGVATFIEDRYDTVTAWRLIYNAHWFELIMLLLAINFIGNIGRYRLFRREKLASLTFHLAFIIMIAGAGITRYTGYGGLMHIREGAASDAVYTYEPYLQIIASGKNKEYSKYVQMYLNANSDTTFKVNLDCGKNGIIEISGKKFIKNAVEKTGENNAGGSDILELAVAGNKGFENIFIKDGEAKDIGALTVAFNNKESEAAVHISGAGSNPEITSSYKIIMTGMMKDVSDTLYRDSVANLMENVVYNVSGIKFAFVKLNKNAEIKLVAGNDEEAGTDVIIADVLYKSAKREAIVYCGTTANPEFTTVDLKDLKLKIGYGSKEIKLPFSLYLNDFILERYAGSVSPSSYESRVTLVDKRYNISESHRIYMNNVLDYGGYRFFQSSYDADEKGTVLAVNHDFWGTWVSYSGYFLLGAGFILTLFSRNSGFFALRQNIKKIRAQRKAAALTVVMLLAFSGIGFSQSKVNNPVSAGHADKFGRLIVQTYDGRFEPVHTLAYDVMHKISRQDNFCFEGKGKMDAVQVLLDIMIDPVYWKDRKMIYIREKSVKDVLGISTEKASFNDFFDKYNQYKLLGFSEKSFSKAPAERNAFDKEITRLDERLNIFIMTCQGSMLRIFPAYNSKNNKWVTWDDSLALVPVTGKMEAPDSVLKSKYLSCSLIMQQYLKSVYSATRTGDYSVADKILGYIDRPQQQSSAADIIPGKTKVELEIFYNKAEIFDMLRNIYGLLSIFMLLLAFIENLRTRKSKIISYPLNFLIILLAIAFIYHTFGMGLRWYLSGHAPWSNGYEALILVAWGGVLAGFSFIRYSKITLAATALLAFSMLMTAGHSSYDPQLTNLQPVLKSYWLIIHVAAITISYGFLGLGFILGLINLFLYLFKSRKNAERLDLLINELACINEMNLTIGIILATAGTFLGGIWANESWGRYWGWDAKETWALIIIIVYAAILHFRLVPGLKGAFLFSVSSVIAFGTVLMTFIGVNYYLSKGLHSYASNDTPVFPVLVWIIIIALFALIAVAGIKERMAKK